MSNVIFFPSRSNKFQEFLSNGSFNVPPGITEVIVEACGGGGGGRQNTVANATIVAGFGAPHCVRIIEVTPGAAISITIGAGGAGVTTGVSNDGGSTFFGSTEFLGGTGAFVAQGPHMITTGVAGKEVSLNFNRYPVGQSGGRIAVYSGGTELPPEFTGTFRLYPESTPNHAAPLNEVTGGSGPFGASLSAAHAPDNSGAGGSNAGGTGYNGGSGRLRVYWK